MDFFLREAGGLEFGRFVSAAFTWNHALVLVAKGRHENGPARGSRNQTTKTFNAEAAEVRGESTSMTVAEVVFSCKTVFLRSFELVHQDAPSWGKMRLPHEGVPSGTIESVR